MNSVTEFSLSGVFLQDRLNIDKKSRTSRLPWRGQFSPEFVEYLLETALHDANHIFDPFCGSGTVIYESALKGRTAIGTEINPSAWHLASLVSLADLEKREIDHVSDTLDKIVLKVSDFEFSKKAIAEILISKETSAEAKKCLTAAILLGMKNSVEFNETTLKYGAGIVKNLIKEIKLYKGAGKCLLEDARQTSIVTDTIDGVITSPPYINVFNYHQNYRPATEMLGWNPLNAAKSEIGANRKYRQNRFLTVIQYCLDMAMVIDELARVSKAGAVTVMVVGRESKVLGTSFLNSEIIKDLFAHSKAFEFTQEAERVFTNRFGQKIYEDVLVFKCVGKCKISQTDARSVGVKALLAARKTAPSESLELIQLAINSESKVLPSPILNLNIPY
ncbi:DNA methyltransferase [Pseudomonas helleri]|uniref:DNA methyltransferase n=1 Tax=Pseudomonas helleri TaxID=1608996 RepID=UPI003FD49A33